MPSNVDYVDLGLAKSDNGQQATTPVWKTVLAMTLVGAAFLVAGAVLSTQDAQEKTIMQVINGEPELSTFAELLNRPAYRSFRSMLSYTKNRLTVLAPNNAAFKNAGLDFRNVAAVSNAIAYHVMPQVTLNIYWPEGVSYFESALTNPLVVNLTDGAGQNIKVENNGTGVPNFLFRPAVFVDEGALDMRAYVRKANIKADQSVIHIIDEVMNPPSDLRKFTTDAETNLFWAAVVEAGLATQFNNFANYTVLVPSDEAFRTAMPYWTPLSPADRARVLRYHVVPRVLVTRDIQTGQEERTLDTDSVTFTVLEGRIVINQGARAPATVVERDHPIKNGAAWELDEVLFPAL